MVTIPIQPEDIMIDITIPHELMLAVMFLLLAMFSLERIKPKHNFTKQQVVLLTALYKMK